MLSYGDLITLAPAEELGDNVPKGLLEAEGLLDPRLWVRTGHELFDARAAPGQRAAAYCCKRTCRRTWMGLW